MYSAPITRLHPTAFILLVDRSGSMAERIVFGGVEMAKSRAVTLVAGSFIDELLYRARREDGTRDYYDIAVLGYSGEGVRSLVSAEGEFVRPSRLAAAGPLRSENVVRERLLPSGRSVVAVTRQSVWFDELASGVTPMCGALGEALALAGRWCRRNSTSYPPTVINITDGEPSDGDDDRVRDLARRIRATSTADGETILMNIHLARASGVEAPVLFPASLSELPDHRYARLLWDASSEMPVGYAETIRAMKGGGEAGAFRAVGWGSHIGEVAAMMNIGSVNSVML
ncbi:MAG: VWA domain-containing protein [Alistipes sp.]|jgi:hypothetical protein|nr:VWA domain-containing protein [Alistipes sp.]